MGNRKHHRTTNWSGLERKRCCMDKCKKRARHNTNIGFVCRKHAQVPQKEKKNGS